MNLEIDLNMPPGTCCVMTSPPDARIPSPPVSISPTCTWSYCAVCRCECGEYVKGNKRVCDSETALQAASFRCRSGVIGYPDCQRRCPREEEWRESPSGLHYIICTDFESACAYRDAWDRLAMEHGDVFSSFDWRALWWQWYGHDRHLRLILFFKDDQLVAVFPLFTEILRVGPLRVRVIRLVGTDHITTLCSPLVHPEYIHRVTADMMATIRDPWDLIELGRLSAESGLGEALRENLRASPAVGYAALTEDPLPQMVIDLPTDADDYLTRLSRRERHNIRQENRRLDREYAVIRENAVADRSIYSVVDEFISLHQQEWIAKGYRGHFADWPHARAFHHAFAYVSARAGRLRLRATRADGKLMAMSYAVRFGRWVHYLYSARSLDPCWHFCFPGRISSYDLMKTAMEEQARCLDFGLGYYEYKAKLGARQIPVQHVLGIRAALTSRIKSTALRGLALSHDLIGYYLWYLTLSRYVPNWHGGLYDGWIHTRIWPMDAPALKRWINSCRRRDSGPNARDDARS